MRRLLLLVTLVLLCCSASAEEAVMTPGTKTDRGFVLDDVLHCERGDIHFSLSVPESVGVGSKPALYLALPGWEGLYFQGVGADLRWETLPFAAREYCPDMVIASLQLNDWGMTSAMDTIALTEYLITAYSVDPDRVFLSGLSGGGETGSLVMGLRPDLYTAYLMVASQWDGDLEALARARTPVYMIIGEEDSYYGSDSLKLTYSQLTDLYLQQGLSEADIQEILVLNVKDADWFSAHGYTDQHAGAVGFSWEPGMLDWFFSRPE